MELGLGQKYNGVQASFTVATAASPVDIFAYTAAANVPAIIERIVITSNANAAAVQAVQIILRSTAGTGGSAGTLTGEPEGSTPAASGTFTYNVTTVGTLAKSSDPEIWQMFAPYEFNRKPGGILVTPGRTFAVSAPTIGTSFVASVHVELVELK